MKSIRCPHCGLLNWATEEACKRCRLALHGNEPVADNQQYESQPSDHQYPEQQQYEQQYEQQYVQQPYEDQHGYQGGQAHGWQHEPAGYQGAHSYAYPGYAAEAPKKTGLAIASMVLGIISLIACGLLGLGTISGFVLGIVALRKAKKMPLVYGGQGFAIAGIALSVVSFFYIGIVAAIAIPNLLAARRAANEAAAVRNIRMLSSAEEVYQSTTDRQQYGTMQELLAAGLIDASLARGAKNNYIFEIKNNGTTFEVLATPTANSDRGSRSFYLSSEEQFIRGAKKGGMAATAYDPPLDRDRPANPYERSSGIEDTPPPMYAPAYR